MVLDTVDKICADGLIVLGPDKQRLSAQHQPLTVFTVAFVINVNHASKRLLTLSPRFHFTMIQRCSGPQVKFERENSHWNFNYVSSNQHVPTRRH